MRFFRGLALAALMQAALMPQAAPRAAMAPQRGESAELLGAQAILYAEGAAKALPGKYTFRVARPPVLPPVRPGRPAFEAERLSKQEPVGRFFVVFRVYVDGLFATTVRVEMEGAWSGSLYQAKNTLQRKTAITEGMLEAIHFEGVPPAGAIKELPGDIRLRQPMAIGKILTNMDIEPIPLISAADRVRVTLKSGGLQIQADATARSSGAKGEAVRLEMDGSKKLVQGTVTGPCQATVALGG